MFAIWAFYLVSPEMFTFRKYFKDYKYLYHLAASIENDALHNGPLRQGSFQGLEITILNYLMKKSELNWIWTLVVHPTI